MMDSTFSILCDIWKKRNLHSSDKILECPFHWTITIMLNIRPTVSRKWDPEWGSLTSGGGLWPPAPGESRRRSQTPSSGPRREQDRRSSANISRSYKESSWQKVSKQYWLTFWSLAEILEQIIKQLEYNWNYYIHRLFTCIQIVLQSVLIPLFV